MSYYHTCHICGANLDPGERCDCNIVKTPGVSDRLTMFYDQASNNDRTVLTVTRGIGDRYEILNHYEDDEAREMYSKLITQAPEGKIKHIL